MPWRVRRAPAAVERDRASIRIAESDDLYRWTRISEVPLFEDICVARDPMLVRRESIWTMHYTRCDTVTKRASGVAYRQSRDLIHWSEPHMLLTLTDLPATTNSAFTESPFVFEHDGYYYLSVTSYPIEWDATFVLHDGVVSQADGNYVTVGTVDVPLTNIVALRLPPASGS